MLETNVWNIKVKIAAILPKTHEIFNMLLIAVQSFKMNAWKPWEELITQSYYLLLKPNLTQSYYLLLKPNLKIV